MVEVKIPGGSKLQEVGMKLWIWKYMQSFLIVHSAVCRPSNEIYACIHSFTEHPSQGVLCIN